jgi:hypothetical protein
VQHCKDTISAIMITAERDHEASCPIIQAAWILELKGIDERVVADINSRRHEQLEICV